MCLWDSVKECVWRGDEETVVDPKVPSVYQILPSAALYNIADTARKRGQTGQVGLEWKTEEDMNKGEKQKCCLIMKLGH